MKPELLADDERAAIIAYLKNRAFNADPDASPILSAVADEIENGDYSEFVRHRLDTRPTPALLEAVEKLLAVAVHLPAHGGLRDRLFQAILAARAARDGVSR